MEKTIVGLIGAVSALAATADSATAMPAHDPMPPVQSYADLLTPLPNTVDHLKASDAYLQSKAAAENQAKVEMAQYYYHHHHHHHRFYPYYHHHHWWHHHHHWHHHHYYRPYYAPY